MNSGHLPFKIHVGPGRYCYLSVEDTHTAIAGIVSPHMCANWSVAAVNIPIHVGLVL